MFKRILFVFTTPVIFFFFAKILSFTSFIETPEQAAAIAEPGSHTYRVYSMPIPDELTFAGEHVPIHNFDVRERFDRELLVNTYWQSQTIQFFKRANRWFPVIEPILAEEGIPDDFKYLALIESGLMNVVSPAGAAGFWQILQTTGRELGLEINNEIDERYHVEKATRAASKFLKDAYSTYQSWTSAAASYNMGRAGLNRQINQQLMSSYYDLWLNEETSRYVFRILAIKTIFENPMAYGYVIRPDDLYHPVDHYVVKVDTTITDLVKFAHLHQVTYKEIRLLNPWLRQTSLPNRSRMVYDIKITRESLFGFEPPVTSEAASPMDN